jgi:hypothetical protein
LVSPKPGKERIRSVILGGVRSNAYCQKYQQWGGLEASVETIYAQEFISDEGKQNSLYWLPAENQPESPHGPLAAHARRRLGGNTQQAPQPFHGYFCRMITKQGNHARGGAKDYSAKGNMTAGFAILAYPGVCS